MTEPQKRRVVVGIDGSSESERALSWAARYGQETGAAVLAVAIWHLPVQFGYRVTEPDAKLELQAATWLEDTLAQVRQTCPDTAITTLAVRGHPTTILVDYSKESDLLVLGNKGQGAVAATLLGSVVPEVVHHARCPVVVVP